MEKNVLIKGTGCYIPTRKVYNEELNEHFSRRGLDASHLMEHLGRRKRYFISENENAITMSINAINNCVEKNHIDLESIEMLVFCSDTPEFMSPSNAMKLVGTFGDRLKNTNVAFDMNSNCTSMIQGMDLVSKYMQSSDVSTALIAGCFCVSPAALWGDTVVYANFADAAACVVLEKQEEEKKRGILDTKVYIDASYQEYVTYPKCGMSKVPLKAIEPNEKRLEWIPFSMDFLAQSWADLIRQLLERNNCRLEQIDYFVFSQLSDAYNTETLKILGIPENKYHYVGTEYGYTGNTCPIMCLNRMWDLYSKEGNQIVFCTIGAGYSIIAQLYKF